MCIRDSVERARQAGAAGLIVTTDWTFSHGRDWGSPKIPEEMNLRTILRLSPEAITKPRWLWKFGKTLRPPDLRVPNQGRRGEPGPPFFAAYGEWMGTPPPTWEDIAWLRELWGGPFMLKGVMRVDDAKRAVDAGVSAISVSNHGGNNLDGTPASIRALPGVAAAVGDQVEVLLDLSLIHILDAPICLTWELTYACNLACVHCLSSSGKRDPRELSTRQCKDIIDELERMQVFYVNIGGGEPTVRPDFWELVDYATAHHVGVKFSTNGVRITPEVAARLAASDYVDVQISLDGATAEVNDAVRGAGSFDMAVRALENLAAAGFSDAKISVVVTRHNVDQLDEFAALASRYGATLRITRLRPSGRGADVWEDLHPTADQQVQLLSLIHI